MTPPRPPATESLPELGGRGFEVAARVSRLTARPARWEDCEVIAADIRAADAAEIAADHLEDVTPLEALRLSYQRSPKPMTFEADGIPLAMAGLCPCEDAPGIWCAWLLGANGLERHKLSFLRVVRDELVNQVKKRSERVTKLYNLVPPSYDRALSWLAWLGFTVQGEAESPGKARFLVLVLECDGGWQEDVVRPRGSLHRPRGDQATAHP